jgi:hypothetical protein
MRGRTTLLIGIACASVIWAQEPMRKSFGDPARFEKTISAFEAADKLAPPPKGAILCTGSSSMRGWHHRIADDLAPLTVIARASDGGRSGRRWWRPMRWCAPLAMSTPP